MGTKNVVNKKKRIAALLTFLKAYDKDGDSFLDCVTEDETWVKHVNCFHRQINSLCSEDIHILAENQ